MRRNVFVLTAMAAALALMIAAGVINYLHRKQAEQARQAAATMTLVPAGAAADGSADEAAAADMAAQENLNTTPLNGKQAPNFTLEDLHGKKVSLSDYKGKPIVVDFWATWCGPCKVEIPWFEQLHKQYAGQGLEILGISADDLDKDDPAKLFTEKRDIADFAKKMGMNYPVLIDADAIARPYGGLDALPTTFFIDRTGKVVASTVGLAPKDEIEANIRKAMGGAAS